MKLVLKILAIIFFALTLAVLLKSLFLSSYPDFSAYYYNPTMVFSGENPYIGGKSLYTPTTYPPFSFLIYSPLSLLGYWLSGKVFTFLSIVALFLSLLLIFKMEELKLKSPLFFFVCGLSFLYFPVKFTLGMGQINLFVLFFLTLFLYFAKQKKIFLSGLFLSLSFIAKLFPVLIFPYLLFRRKYKLLAYSIAVVIVFILLSFIFIPKETNIFFYQKILPTFFSSWQSDYYNQSISGALARSVSESQLKIVLKVLFISFMVIVSGIILFKGKIRNIKLEVGYIITLTLLINPFSWQHHFALLILPIVLTLSVLLKNNARRFFYFLLLISYALTATNFKEPNFLPTLLQSHVFFGALALWILDSILILNISGESLKHSLKKSSQD